MEWLAMYEDEWLTLYIILIFVAFISGLFLGALFSPARERKAREPWHARLAAAEGEPSPDGKKRSMNLPAVVLALVVVSGVIVADQFKGPLFTDAFYCPSDGGTQPNTQQRRDVAVRRPSPMDVRGDDGEDE
jgi:formate hydrogenlyase subunit 3/multisubunit Na+/H+ antiporter MnhD subunit